MQTIYNIGQKVVVLVKSKAVETVIHSINIENNLDVNYFVNIPNELEPLNLELYNEAEIFNTKEELIKQL
jgi:hypothetical protein